MTHRPDSGQKGSSTMPKHLDAYKTTGTSPPLKITVTRMEVSPGSTVGVGHGTDPRDREILFGADWRCALAIAAALDAGVDDEGPQASCWRGMSQS